MNDSNEMQRLRQGADLDSLPRLTGLPATTGIIRSDPADFSVRESLAFDLTGAGEHLYLLVRKTDQNTRWVAKQLARAFGLPFRAVGYAGLKDRHAIAEQWFSLHLPGREDPEPDAIAIDGVEVLEQRRHSTKLRVGALRGNEFRIVIRDLSGDHDDLERRLSALRVRDGCVPNFFGAQRFGRGGGNLNLFHDLERPVRMPRESRTFALSAVRSALFNNYLAQRIVDGSATVPQAGEIVYCEAERSYRHEPDVRGVGQMYRATGLLWGSGESRATDVAVDYEGMFFARYPATTRLLADHDVRMMRRPLMIRPEELEWHIDEQQATVSFTLGRGQFATAVLRECVTCSG